MKEDERKVEGSLRGHIQVLRGLSPPLGCTGNHQNPCKKCDICTQSDKNYPCGSCGRCRAWTTILRVINATHTSYYWRRQPDFSDLNSCCLTTNDSMIVWTDLMLQRVVTTKGDTCQSHWFHCQWWNKLMMHITSFHIRQYAWHWGLQITDFRFPLTF